MYPAIALVSFFALLLLTVPVAISLGFGAIIPAWFGAPMNTGQSIRTMVTAIDSFPFLAVPLFMMAGDLMTRGGLARRLFSFADAMTGRISGGLGISTVVACMLFGAISGSSPATVAAIGAMAIPLLLKQGYDLRFASVLVTTAGTLGVIVPPSIPMIIYGMSANVSVSALFMGGVLPALVIGGLLMLYAYWYGRNNRDKIVTTAGQVTVLQAAKDSFWALLAPIIVLGGIYTGVFTPTEAAAIAVGYSAFVSIVVFREMNLAGLVQAVAGTATTIAPILIIAGTGAAIGRTLNLLGVPQMLGTLLGGAVSDQLMMLLVVNMILLVVGMVMETIAAIIVLTPILLPLVTQYNVDPVHFGVIMTVNLAIGFVTPPVGANLYIASGLTGLSVVRICQGILVPLVFLLIGLLIITYVPGLTLWLPSLLG